MTLRIRRSGDATGLDVGLGGVSGARREEARADCECDRKWRGGAELGEYVRMLCSAGWLARVPWRAGGALSWTLDDA